LFLCDARTKQTRQIAFEEDGLGAWRDDYELRAWSWAPDDSALVYTMQDKLVVYRPDAGQPAAEMTVPVNSVSQLAWLTPTRFAFVQSGTNLCCARREEGRWQYQSCPFPGYDTITGLTALSTHTVAWLQDGLVCRLDLDQTTPDTSPAPTAGDAAVSGPETAPPGDGLVLWLDGSTVRQPDQTPVRALPDLSPRRNAALANGNPPLFNAPDGPGALNGKGTIHFSSGPGIANATGLKTERGLGLQGSAPRTIYAVARRQAGKELLINTGKLGAFQEYCGLVDNDWGIYLPRGLWVENACPALVPRWNILAVVYDGTNESGLVNGALKGRTHFPINTPDVEVELGLRVPKNGDLAQAAASDGDFAELLVYDRALNVAEQQRVETYLSRKWFGGGVITAQNPKVWVNPKIKGVTDLAWSRDTGRLLLRVEDGPQKSFWLCDSNGGGSAVLPADSAPGAQWVGPDTFAYVTGGTGRNQIVVADARGAEPSRQSVGATLRAFSVAPAGDRMLLVGTVSNEPAPGIWQCDLKTGELQNLVAYSGRPCPDATRGPVLRSYVRPNWPELSCVIYPPPKVERGRKYPLIISDTVIADALHGPMFQSGIAGAGAYVAITERIYWPTGIEQWATNVLHLYDDLKQDPTVDRQRIYLFAASAETRYLGELIAKTPGPWRGLILLNPSMLPDFSKAPLLQPRPKILIVAGGQEREEQRFQKYQQDSLSAGVLVDYLIGAGETHRYVGKTAKRERAEAVEKFIFEE
jgi:hypothetical protein